MKNKKCEGIDCAWCMCIECPREKDTTMTDKEQIMIDGVDVSECIFLDIVNERLWCDNVNISAIGKSQCPYVDCFKNPDCYYKQLTRKTQECDELKRKVELMMDCPDCKVDEYKKAIEEIEEECNYAPMCDTEFSQRVLDIINKTKDGE